MIDRNKYYEAIDALADDIASTRLDMSTDEHVVARRLQEIARGYNKGLTHVMTSLLEAFQQHTYVGDARQLYFRKWCEARGVGRPIPTIYCFSNLRKRVTRMYDPLEEGFGDTVTLDRPVPVGAHEPPPLPAQRSMLHVPSAKYWADTPSVFED